MSQTTQITFVYGGDIWVMPKAGGTAIQVTHSPGEESWPKVFSRWLIHCLHGQL